MKYGFIVFVFIFAWPLSAFSNIVGTAHETVLGGKGGPCAACHIPHQAAGEKLWAREVMQEGKVGPFSALCAICHHSGDGYGAVMSRAHSDDFVYGKKSHGTLMHLENSPPGTDASASGLPYVDEEKGIFECTTCHSVHDDANRPFLRDSINAICARCHTQRHYVGGVDKTGALVEPGKWGDSYRGKKNPGSHPVGEDVAAGREGAPVIEIPAALKIGFSKEPGKWSLGGHLTNGNEGGVTCTTCHAVHGTEVDSDDPAFGKTKPMPPVTGFLAIEQPEMNISGYDRPIPNGNGGTSALCEACHGVGNNPNITPFGDQWSSSELNVNPGLLGTYSHPIDSYPASTDAGIDSFPDGWPAGDPTLAGMNVLPVPICESCHTPHPQAALQVNRSDVESGAGPYLLRSFNKSGGIPVCDMCHEKAVPNHHPVDIIYDSSGVYYLSNTIGAASDRLTCATCHTKAHGWRGPGWAGLDPAWLPQDNGREMLQAADMYNKDMSKTCMDCHYFMDGDGKSVSPTLGANQSVIQNTDDEYEHYQIVDKSMGTHYIGLIHEDGEWQKDPLIDIFNVDQSWSQQNIDPKYSEVLAYGWSRFGGEDLDGSRVLVCESCHELEPDKNRGIKHLLLAPYEEGQNGIDEFEGDDDGHDLLCESCHGIPKGTHPMSGMIVGRTNNPLSTQAGWLREKPLGYATLDLVVQAQSCDSCHQPHDANSLSYTFILDAPETSIEGSTLQPVSPGDLDEAQPSALKKFGYGVAGTGTVGDYATPTLRDQGGAISGFCAQCHTN